MKRKKFSIMVLLAMIAGSIFAQKSHIDKASQYIFSNDSIAGFDETAASAAAFQNNCFGKEFNVCMYLQKRKFINEKYNIKAVESPVHRAAVVPPPAEYFAMPKSNARSALLPSSGACANEDFEDAQANPGAQVGGAINGWNVYGGTGANFCNPNAVSATNLYTVYNAPVIDQYMLFPSNSISSYFDATSNAQPAGNCFIRLNNDLAGGKVVKLTKTYIVSPGNAVFRYAYRAVISNPGHSCCDQPGFVIYVSITNTVTNTSTLLPCPQVTVAAGTSCGPAAPGFSVGNPLNGSPSAYNPSWVPAAIDLSPYLGYQVTLNVYAIDCALGGHAGYVYFDALCCPMTIIGNNNGFPAGTPSITLPTCGAAGATITAPAGLGPYSWSSGQISIPANLTVPNYTNTTLITNQSGTVQLTMNPPGSCAPINKIITVTITPAPIAVGSVTQAGCTNTLTAASLTTAGSASVNPVITWSPSPGSLSNNSLTATGLPVGTTTVTVQDIQGCKVTVTMNILPAPPPVTFTINNLSGSYSITCHTPTINLQAVSNYTYGTLSYSWTSPSFTANTSAVALISNLTLTVIAIDPATGCSATQTVAIGMNTVAPTMSVSPSMQAITCSSTSAATFTSTIFTPTVNMWHFWYNSQSPTPFAVSGNSISLNNIVSPGIYTVVAIDSVNGCRTQKTVTVTSLSAFPTFSIGSSTNFSVGCAPLNQTTLCIINPVSTQTPAAVCSYTFLPPGFGGTLSPTGNFGANTCTVTTIPGTWTLIVQDNSNFCRTQIPVSIIQNTVAPNVVASMLTQTLNCFTPTILATGSSTTSNTNVSWLMPVNPPGLPSPTLVIGTPPTGPNPSTTSLVYASFTVVATNTVNACQSMSVVAINQNFKAPVSSPTISAGTAQAIYCTAGVNPVVLTTGGSTVNTGGFAVPFLWQGPSPQQTVTGTSTYSCYIPGPYSLTIMDSYNGCKTTATINVLDRTQPPVITNPVDQATLDCGSSQAILNFALTGTMTGGVRFLVIEYPTGTAFNPVNAPLTNINPVLSGTSSNSVSVSLPGYYEYVVSNTLTGCQASGTINVLPGDITADFDPDATSGFAPMTVNFQNNSHTSLGTGSINSIWNYGNGTSSTFSSVVSTSATYTASGTYTVMLLAQKGTCIDTTYKVIKVDIPSKLEIPNVFTPNGDGSNDVFFLKVANLTEINAMIFDRWGNKVYEVNSSTGNIAWDGKSLQGKECPDGTYFYIVKASGKDDKNYEQKGNVSLFR
jgi:gliding motility-associated-like protein